MAAPSNPRVALAFSGGGFRASLFHLGVLRRVAEAGWLRDVDVISTVSGGSVVGAFLAQRWERLAAQGYTPDSLEEHVVRPFLEIVTRTNFIAEWAARLVLLPLRKLKDHNYTRTKLAAELFDRIFFASGSCSSLPEKPYLILNATSLVSIRAWRFTREGMGDSRIGHAAWGTNSLSLGEAVGASAGFPPVFPPARIESHNYKFSSPIYGEPPLPTYPLIPLTDGGVYDNMGVEVVTKESVLPGVGQRLAIPDFLVVSDAGYPAQYRFRASGLPGLGDALLLYRVDAIAREQVSALRRRDLVSDFGDRRATRRGVLVMLGSSIAKIPDGRGEDYALHIGPKHIIPAELVDLIRGVRTHFDRFSKVEGEALMYHAYTMTDAFLWAHRETCPKDYRVPETPAPAWRIEFTADLGNRWRDGLAQSGRLRI